MVQSESITELAKALCAAQKAAQNPKMDSKNDRFAKGNKNNYASIVAVLDVIKGPLADNGLSVSQFIESIANDHWLTTVVCHVSGQWMRSSMLLTPMKADSQGIVGAVTYMRRASLCALMGIAGEVDDDGESIVIPEAQKEAPKAKPVSPVGHKFVDRLQLENLMKHVKPGTPIYDNVLKHYQIQALDQLLASDYDKLMERVRK